MVKGAEVTWKRHHAADYFIDFNEFVGQTTPDAVAYAVCYVVADHDLKDLTLRTGSDDQIKVYLNGRAILSYDHPRVLSVDDDTAPHVTLHKGVNVLVIKVVNWIGDWLACVRFVDNRGQVVRGLKVTVAKP